MKTIIKFTTKDKRRAALHISLAHDRLELFAEVEGSNKLRLIGEESTIGITLGPGYDKQAIQNMFDILNT